MTNALLSQIQDSINQIEPKVTVKISNSNGILIVEVPESHSKPHTCSDGYFLRIGPNSQKLKRDEVIKLFKKEGIRFDELENRKATYTNDFDNASYRNFLEKSDISPKIKTKQLLTNLGCLIDDNRFSNAGVLFFCKSSEFFIPQATVTCVLYKGTEKLNVIDRKDFKANILINIEEAIAFILRHTNLMYKIEHVRREEIQEIPEVAIREAVINAVCHRDYFVDNIRVMVEVFDDRVTIINPGGLPSGLSSKTFGTISIPRNPLIADLLHRANYIEQIGTGINRIKAAVSESSTCKVKFSYDDHWFYTIFLRNQATSILPQKIIKSNSELELTKRQQEILDLFNQKNVLTSNEISDVFSDISLSGVRKQLRKLKSMGYIDYTGSTKSRKWILIK